MALARRRAILGVMEFKEMFDLPKDAEIINIKIEDGIIEFEMLSAEEHDGFVKADMHNLIRRTRLVRKGE